MNIARDYSGRAPTVKSCSEGVWREKIDKSGIEHETYVILDDRKHKSGNLFGFVNAPVEGAAPSFPMIFVLDHNGKVLNKTFQGLSFDAITKLVKAQEETFDKELKKALKSKKDSDSDDKSSKDEK